MLSIKTEWEKRGNEKYYKGTRARLCVCVCVRAREKERELELKIAYFSGYLIQIWVANFGI